MRALAHPLPITSRSPPGRICLPGLPTGLEARRPGAYPPASPHRSSRTDGGIGISTDCPSTTPCGLALGPTNPRRTNLASEPWGLRCGGFPPPVRYSYRHSHFRALQPSSRSAFPAPGTLPYHVPGSARCLWTGGGGAGTSIASVLCLSPGGLSAPDHVRPVSCYALFQGWLLLSQPPGCLRDDTSLPTQDRFRGLSWRSGLFPF